VAPFLQSRYRLALPTRDHENMHKSSLEGDLDKHDEAGMTPLCRAAYYGYYDEVHDLLARGASVHIANGIDATPLHCAAYRGCHAVAALLLDRGARIESRSRWLYTPLLAACSYGRLKTAVLLLHRGANVDARDINGRSSEDLASFSNHAETTALLARVRVAGGWRGYVREPRKRLVALRILCEQGRASAGDDLLRRLFPAGPRLAEGTKRRRGAYRAQKGGALPRGIFWHIFGYWRSIRDYDLDRHWPAPKSDSESEPGDENPSGLPPGWAPRREPTPGV